MPGPASTTTPGARSSPICGAAGIRPAAQVPAGVEAVRRSGERSWFFLLNHTDEPQQVPASGHDLISGQPYAGGRPGARRAVAVPGGVSEVLMSQRRARIPQQVQDTGAVRR